MFCPKCGKVNDDQARFCQYCGFSLRPDPLHRLSQTPTVISKTSLNYAGFWSRSVASCIDALILALGALIITFPFLIAQGIVNITTYPYWNPYWVAFDSVLSMVIGWLYCTLLESSTKQATIGKMAVGLIVTDLEGKRISFGRANGRWWGKFISFLILGVGYIMAGFTQKKQGLHDVMADTLVVKKYGKVNPWAIWIVIIFMVVPILFFVGFISGATIAILIGKKDVQTAIMAPQEAPVPPPSASPSPPTPKGPSPMEVASRVETLTDVLKKDPKNLSAWVELGNLYFDSNQPKEAIDAYNHYLAINPNNADVRTDLGVMYRKIGDLDRTISEFKKAAEIDPKHTNSRYNLGIVFLHDKRDIKGAIKAFEDYLKVDPKSERADKIKDQLKKMKEIVQK